MCLYKKRKTIYLKLKLACYKIVISTKQNKQYIYIYSMNKKKITVNILNKLIIVIIVLIILK